MTVLRGWRIAEAERGPSSAIRAASGPCGRSGRCCVTRYQLRHIAHAAVMLTRRNRAAIDVKFERDADHG